MTNDIHTRALLVWLTISTWSARRYDKTVTRKVNADMAATEDAGRYNKLLLPGDASSYKTLTALAGSIRAQHYANTLAWSDEGWRLLPTANYMTYVDWFRGQQAAFTQSLDSFVSDYPALKSVARAKLNGMYRDEDYPDPADVRQRFALDVHYAPVPSRGDIRVNLADDTIAAIEATIEHRITEATRIASQDAWNRLYEVCERMVERLGQPDAIFRDSLITNTREVCDTLKALNVTNDPALDTMRQRVAAELTRFDPDVLRDTPALRQTVADKAQAILDSMRANGAIV